MNPEQPTFREARVQQTRALTDTVRKRGRPRADTPHATVSTWLPADAHDRLIRIANQREMSVSALVRRVIILTLR